MQSHPRQNPLQNVILDQNKSGHSLRTSAPGIGKMKQTKTQTCVALRFAPAR